MSGHAIPYMTTFLVIGSIKLFWVFLGTWAVGNVFGWPSGRFGLSVVAVVLSVVSFTPLGMPLPIVTAALAFIALYAAARERDDSGSGHADGPEARRRRPAGNHEAGDHLGGPLAPRA